MTIGEKDDTPEYYARRAREAYSQWIKEHPGERVPIQGGDLAGIDPETGEDIRKTNQEREKEKEYQKKVQELQKYGDDIEPVPTMSEEAIRIMEETMAATKLPDNYEGITIYINPTIKWQAAQLHCTILGRRDLDFQYPEGLPPDILSQCHFITINRSPRGGGYLLIEVYDSTNKPIYLTTFQEDTYIMSFKGNKLQG